MPDTALFDVVGGTDEPLVDEDHPDAPPDGFEGGRVRVVDGTEHLFTCERVGAPDRPPEFADVKTRLAHWRRPEGEQWRRTGTVFASTGRYTPCRGDNPYSDRRASLWGPVPVYDRDVGRWTLFYTAYAARRDAALAHRYGRIWRAVSASPGRDGIDGPYRDVGVVLEPGVHSQDWEGRQGVDSFCPFETPDGDWVALYGSAFPAGEDRPFDGQGHWHVGLASAPALEGPWTRLSARENPLTEIHPGFVENPIVSRLGDGTYAAVFDGGPASLGYPGAIGCSVSPDGRSWSRASYVRPEAALDRWWETVRTPLGLRHHGGVTYSTYFTAWREDHQFHPIGRVDLRLDPDALAPLTAGPP